MKQLEADSSGASEGRLFDELRKKYSDRRDFCFTKWKPAPRKKINIETWFWNKGIRAIRI